ncbi:uncharacterized protein LAESUDRAFT_808275 [Laetiporus sulphureus 93-53]|uniref:BTB domain-containing protein n=1 Tax=Laetiporus sulphureus 93-53 TaxID=1314785 RepID=A0A165I8D7_9APHY|nr:uncharacterized protein LAESUDRAFT_808275 [Laetiporus sulphureus 93-53]KZT12724.1 hypothetical protein LAESUDRAFT_808275 [Laetiporus sulphureus 93-53]
MSDQSRQSPRSPLVMTSPSRPSPLSRPHWPWSTYTHRSSSSSSSVHSNPYSSTPTPVSWESRNVVTNPSPILVSTSGNGKRNTGPSGSLHYTVLEESTTRQWSFSAFEWIVRDVRRLRDFVEAPEATDQTDESDEPATPDAGYFEILRESPVIGDGKFKLEIAKTPILENPEEIPAPAMKAQTQTLSLYITSLMVDFPHTEYEMSTSLFAAIKCQDDKVGERGARPDWAWEYWHDGWVFRHESEVWECPLPPLSSLLENPRIKETDSFVICVQMHSPTGPFFPQQPSAYYVPRDLLEGLEASLDNPNTGDVQFICLERQEAREELREQQTSPPITAETLSASSTSQLLLPRATARKRVIYAHSDILIRRSDYFATMLSSSFSENTAGIVYPGERKIYTVVVEEADFITIYWLLKFVYANWVLFRKDDDPREAVDGIGAGWSARGLGTSDNVDEWGWKTLSKGTALDASNSGGASDTRSVTSAGSVQSNGAGSGKSADKEKQVKPAPITQTPPSRTPSSAKGTPVSSRVSTSQSRRSGPSSGAGGPPTPSVSSSNAVSTSRMMKPVPVPISPPAGAYASSSHHSMSPRQPRQRSHPPMASTTDPHAHPTSPPPPASALSMYQIAHRYGMPGLATLALEHIMSTITPQSSFAILLAAATWEELHSLVEDYVVEKWDDVSVSNEFERCCQEVASGEWGPAGGKTMMALFRRLRSPSAAT